jgi:DNA-binding GntR family transcriptional regulator
MSHLPSRSAIVLSVNSSNAPVRSPAGMLNFRSKTDLVTDYLRQELQSGRLRAGDRIVISRVAADLGVSKVPVREAVTRLVGERLLELRSNVGPVVPEFTAHEVIETALLRTAVERVALEHALPRHDEESIHRAEEVLDLMGSDDAHFPDLNVRFHLALIAPSPYKGVNQTASALLEQSHRYRTAHRVPGYLRQAHEEHLGLVEAIRSRDADALLALNEHHIMNAAHRLREHMSQRPS